MLTTEVRTASYFEFYQVGIQKWQTVGKASFSTNVLLQGTSILNLKGLSSPWIFNSSQFCFLLNFYICLRIKVFLCNWPIIKTKTIFSGQKHPDLLTITPKMQCHLSLCTNVPLSFLSPELYTKYMSIYFSKQVAFYLHVFHVSSFYF